jgi:rare lipoprotein A
LNKYKKVPAIQYGVASYYHDKFEGRTTANGEIFTQKKMTAASNKFPLNCWVRVTNTHTKKSIVVRIIDRMHHLNTRLIDLSRRAAEELQFIKRGLVRVKVEYLGTEAPEDWVEDQVIIIFLFKTLRLFLPGTFSKLLGLCRNSWPDRGSLLAAIHRLLPG